MENGKRRTIRVACDRCHQQHIRCDANQVGVPCTNCQKTRNLYCQLLQNDRTRSVTGRFIRRKQKEISETLPTSDSKKSIDVPTYSVDFNELCSDATPAEPSDAIIPYKENSAANIPRQESIWSESWYLSYLVQTTNNEHSRLYRPIDYNQSRREIRPGSTISNHVPASALQTLLVQQSTTDLVDGYFKNFHSFCPILNKVDVLHSIQNRTISIVLLKCMLFVSSIHCNEEVLYTMGYKKRINAEDDLFEKANSAFNSDVEADKLTLLFCSYLLHYWSGRPTTYKDSLWWLAGAIRTAQSLNMHRKAGRENFNNEKEWKRIWWLLYIRDRQISISLGKPMVIHDSDCDIDFLKEADFIDESIETRSYVMAQARLSVIISRICTTYFSPSLPSTNPYLDTVSIFEAIEDALLQWRLKLPFGMESDKRAQLNIILHMTYNYYRIVLHQKSKYCSNSDFSQNCNVVLVESAEAITILMENAVIMQEARLFPMICVTAIFSAMTVQYIASKRIKNDQQQALHQRLKFNLLGLKEFEQCHVLAHWIRQLFRNIIEKMPEPPLASVDNIQNEQNSSFSILEELNLNANRNPFSTALPEFGISELGNELFTWPEETLFSNDHFGSDYHEWPLANYFGPNQMSS